MPSAGPAGAPDARRPRQGAGEDHPVSPNRPSRMPAATGRGPCAVRGCPPRGRTAHRRAGCRPARGGGRAHWELRGPDPPRPPSSISVSAVLCETARTAAAPRRAARCPCCIRAARRPWSAGSSAVTTSCTVTTSGCRVGGGTRSREWTRSTGPVSRSAVGHPNASQDRWTARSGTPRCRTPAGRRVSACPQRTVDRAVLTGRQSAAQFAAVARHPGGRDQLGGGVERDPHAHAAAVVRGRYGAALSGRSASSLTAARAAASGAPARAHAVQATEKSNHVWRNQVATANRRARPSGGKHRSDADAPRLASPQAQHQRHGQRDEDEHPDHAEFDSRLEVVVLWHHEARSRLKCLLAGASQTCRAPDPTGWCSIVWTPFQNAETWAASNRCCCSWRRDPARQAGGERRWNGDDQPGAARSRKLGSPVPRAGRTWAGTRTRPRPARRGSRSASGSAGGRRRSGPGRGWSNAGRVHGRRAPGPRRTRARGRSRQSERCRTPSRRGRSAFRRRSRRGGCRTGSEGAPWSTPIW